MKMHGLGNDFVVLDARAHVPDLTASLIVAIADRHRGIGFDQLAVITDRARATLHLTFYNADGSTSAACGNATRCIARHLMDETGKTDLTLTTDRGTLRAVDAGGGLTSVNMGQPNWTGTRSPWQDRWTRWNCPSRARRPPPAWAIRIAPFSWRTRKPWIWRRAARAMEHHPLFPQRTNVQFASLLGPDHLRMRVWERGVGVTLASGSSSCATAVAAARRGLTGRRVTITLDGGEPARSTGATMASG